MTTTATTDDLRSLRRDNRLRRERLDAADLEIRERQVERRRLRESWASGFWTQPYIDLYTAGRSSFDMGGWGGPSSMWQRRQGRNYPFFQNEQQLSLLRFPSRYLCSANSYAIGMLQGLLGYIIGPGITYRAVVKPNQDADATAPLVEAVQQVIDAILDANEWHGGEMPGFEDEFVWRTFEDGEAFALSFPLPTGMTQWRFVEPEQVTQPPGSDLDEWSFGIRCKKTDMQNPLGYYVAWSEDVVNGEEFTAERMTHFRRNAKRTIKRGTPEFSFDTHDSIDAASKLRGNMGEAAAQQATVVAVMKAKTGTPAEIQAVATSPNSFYLPDPYTGQQIGIRKSERGTTEWIPDSQEYVNGPAASNAEAHLAVLQGLLRAVCVRWNMPEWFGSADSSQTNRSNGMTAERLGINRILREQRRYCSALRRMVREAVEHYANVKGIAGKGWDELSLVLDIATEAPEPVAQDPLVVAQVAAIEIPLGVQSPQNYMQDQGRDAKRIEMDNQEWAASHEGMPAGADVTAFMTGQQDAAAAKEEGKDDGDKAPADRKAGD
jgi:hypothetical protein